MFNLSNKTYDILKWVITIVMPALAGLYSALALLFAWPYAEQVPASIMTFVLFMGAFLSQSSALYNANAGSARPLNVEPYLFQMSEELYKTLKWIVQVALPAMSVAYLAMAEIWQLAWANEVTGVIAALVAFFSAILQISSDGFKAALKRADTNLPY